MAYDVTGRQFSKTHEIFALGMANLVVGTAGGLPVSCGIPRTMLSIANGARSRASGLIHSLLLLIFAYVLLPAMQLMPVAIICSLQVSSAIRSINTDALKALYRLSKPAFFTTCCVALMCVALTPFVGMLIGIIASMMLFSNELSKVRAQ